MSKNKNKINRTDKLNNVICNKENLILKLTNDDLNKKLASNNLQLNKLLELNTTLNNKTTELKSSLSFAENYKSKLSFLEYDLKSQKDINLKCEAKFKDENDYLIKEFNSKLKILKEENLNLILKVNYLENALNTFKENKKKFIENKQLLKNIKEEKKLTKLEYSKSLRSIEVNNNARYEKIKNSFINKLQQNYKECNKLNTEYMDSNYKLIILHNEKLLLDNRYYIDQIEKLTKYNKDLLDKLRNYKEELDIIKKIDYKKLYNSDRKYENNNIIEEENENICNSSLDSLNRNFKYNMCTNCNKKLEKPFTTIRKSILNINEIIKENHLKKNKSLFYKNFLKTKNSDCNIINYNALKTKYVDLKKNYNNLKNDICNQEKINELFNQKNSYCIVNLLNKYINILKDNVDNNLNCSKDNSYNNQKINVSEYSLEYKDNCFITKEYQSNYLKQIIDINKLNNEDLVMYSNMVIKMFLPLCNNNFNSNNLSTFLNSKSISNNLNYNIIKKSNNINFDRNIFLNKLNNKSILSNIISSLNSANKYYYNKAKSTTIDAKLYSYNKLK